MRIAIVIAAFNVAPFLRQTLQSVLDQTHPDWSLIVVDDGSTDATAAIASSISDNRIRLIQQDNAGVSAARNRGIHEATSLSADALLFLDGDDWLAPNALTLLSKTLDAAPWAVAACGRYTRVATDGSARLSAAPPNGCVLERLLIQNQFANGGHLLIRREATEAAGNFRADLTYGEDWEYWTRIASLGEFTAAGSRAPVLFVRERPGGATQSKATDPKQYHPAMQAIHGNPDIADRLGRARLAYLQRRARAEMEWTIGRERIRHGQQTDGLRWLCRSIQSAPSLRRLLLIALSQIGYGQFRPYHVRQHSRLKLPQNLIGRLPTLAIKR